MITKIRKSRAGVPAGKERDREACRKGKKPGGRSGRTCGKGRRSGGVWQFRNLAHGCHIHISIYIYIQAVVVTTTCILYVVCTICRNREYVRVVCSI